ncbi:TIR domain-containing protein [Psychrilyobacter atlanticus]|uniref:TIR domain-containing protein n=1 Tax=Psychrilyobacter atlanticus TaxID=271091 RepID=UPI00042388E6|nr:TIR domain-containing protein [Psychrilyobacter atlanticus]
MNFFNLKDINKTIENSNFNKLYGESVIMESAGLENDASTKIYDIFLSHSYLDSKQIYVIKKEIENMGFSVYVDWIEDFTLNRKNVNKKTALLLKKRMESCKSLFYATTENYQHSKWMPWELGYFDGIKGKVAVLPILFDENSIFEGTEYLELYPYVDKGASKQNLLINDNGCTSFLDWIK